MAIIIDGKETAAKVRTELKAKIDEMVAVKKRRPCLAVILVGEDPASAISSAPAPKSVLRTSCTPLRRILSRKALSTS